MRPESNSILHVLSCLTAVAIFWGSATVASTVCAQVGPKEWERLREESRSLLEIRNRYERELKGSDDEAQALRRKELGDANKRLLDQLRTQRFKQVEILTLLGEPPLRTADGFFSEGDGKFQTTCFYYGSQAGQFLILRFRSGWFIGYEEIRILDVE